ncbi:MAG: inorganic phosphate transporter [bacterium]|nr:inorganic phosphate transporter [bacterium]MDD3624923.1 inorganic phosphate transporter [Proteiniphilum sp.]MDD3968695.1 inorganic phosphate transporter [Proteiniphilum sp.]MDD4458643.1 inorganic phosphate transporter [Proteiniphilum sp.]
MDPIYLIIVIVLLGLATLDLIVGVSNDAVNFLNSSIGSRVAPLWMILTVASLGVMIGAMFSSGMMEVARSGVFYPEKFTFPAIMTLFLAVMITDVILLDLFNTFGLPTSTTVSLVFELLGASVAVALFTIWTQDTAGELGNYINSGKALAIISGIFISIAIAFLVGSIIMYISRLIFSFNYGKRFRYLGAIWGGIALTAIIYFAIFKGLKGSVLVTPATLSYLEEHMGIALFYTFTGATLLMALLQHLFRVNILKVIVLSGTAALAMAFAGNDLVNFIGVFMAGYDSFRIAGEVAVNGGNIEALYMDKLNEPVVANIAWLIGAGVIMILALWFSKKSRSVTETEVNLARKGEGVERFSSSPLSRSMVRGSLTISKSIEKVTPAPVKRFIDRQFAPVETENEASFDLIRASVNLTIAALLISLGTSLKLPLSTTFVTFMVAMGSSLADRAWGRDSAVYRINGVLTVVAGWLMTALIAFTVALLIGLFLMWGGKIAIALMILLVVFILYKSGRIHTKRKSREQQHQQVFSSEIQLVTSCNEDVRLVLDKTLTIFENVLHGMRDEERKTVKKAMAEANELYEKFKDKRTYEVVPTLESMEMNALDLEQEYVQLVDYSYEITKSLKAVTEASFRYIDNNHAAFSKEQIEDLEMIYKILTEAFNSYREMDRKGDYSQFAIVNNMRDVIFDLYQKLNKRQIKRVKAGASTTRSSILFLNLVNEAKIITLQSGNLLKSHRNFKENYAKAGPDVNAKTLIRQATLNL